MTYEEMLDYYGLKDSSRNLVSVKDLMDRDFKELDELRERMKQRIKEIDVETDVLLLLEYDTDTKEGKQKERQKNRKIQHLADERFLTSRFSSEVYSAYIKKRRKSLEDVSTKALNHGGVYSCPSMEKPRVGMGFRGYKGITL